jgi:hypothetical protein
MIDEHLSGDSSVSSPHSGHLATSAHAMRWLPSSEEQAGIGKGTGRGGSKR